MDPGAHEFPPLPWNWEQLGRGASCQMRLTPPPPVTADGFAVIHSEKVNRREIGVLA